MGVSKDLAGLLRANIDQVPHPDGFEAYREALKRIRPNRAPPSIKESPENRRSLDDSEGSSHSSRQQGTAAG